MILKHKHIKTYHVGAGGAESVCPTHQQAAILCCVQNPDEVFTFLLKNKQKKPPKIKITTSNVKSALTVGAHYFTAPAFHLTESLFCRADRPPLLTGGK